MEEESTEDQEKLNQDSPDKDLTLDMVTEGGLNPDTMKDLISSPTGGTDPVLNTGTEGIDPVLSTVTKGDPPQNTLENDQALVKVRNQLKTVEMKEAMDTLEEEDTFKKKTNSTTVMEVPERNMNSTHPR